MVGHRSTAYSLRTPRGVGQNGCRVVTLRGIVSSLAEMEEAQRTAWSAPGVKAVTNRLVVNPEDGEL